MKQINFSTSKGEFLVVDMEQDGVLDKYDGTPFEYMLPLKEITEDEAAEIVDGFDKIPNDVPNNIQYCKLLLQSLIKSKDLFLYENPLPKPENYDLWAKYGDFTQYGKTLTIDCLRWKEAEEKTYYNPFIFKL